MSDQLLIENPDRQQRRARGRGRRGVAMILVLIVVAMAMIIGLAVLSSSALQARVSGSASGVLNADTFSESGVSLATYYLMNPDKAPALNTDGYWPGTTTA